jgi:hypothetical protein
MVGDDDEDDREERRRAIEVIEATFPPDSPHDATGHRLWEQARRETLSWRDEPTAVLVRLARLCEGQARIRKLIR